MAPRLTTTIIRALPNWLRAKCRPQPNSRVSSSTPARRLGSKPGMPRTPRGQLRKLGRLLAAGVVASAAAAMLLTSLWAVPADPYFTISLGETIAVREVKVNYQITVKDNNNMVTATKIGADKIEAGLSSKVIRFSELNIAADASNVTMLLLACPENSCQLSPTQKTASNTPPAPDNS